MKKNILILIGNLEKGGGAEKVASIIGNKLHNKNHKVYFMTFYETKNPYHIHGELYCNNETASQNLIINFFKLIKRARNISKFCKKNNIHSTISFMEDINFSNIISKILFRNKSKILVSVHNNVNKISYFSRKLIQLLYNFSDTVVTVVHEEKENLSTNYNIHSHLIKVIHNPLIIKDIEKQKNKPLSKENMSIFGNKNTFRFINIGRLINVKNQIALIDAFKKFEKIFPESQLIIIGEGELRGELEKQIAGSKNIHLLGLCKNPYMYLDSSDCFLFSSLNEGFGLVLTEAMACGLPVISYDCPTGPKEILKDSISDFKEIQDISYEKYGVLVPNNNPQLLFQSMKTMYTDPKLREKYKKNAPARALEFDINKIIKLWEEII